MKYLVETTGDFGLIDIFGGQEVSPWRPSVVSPTGFIEGKKGSHLRVIEVLDDEATDEMLATAKDLDAAIAALPRLAKDAPAKPAKPAAKK